MNATTIYQYLSTRPDKQTTELYLCGTGVRASTIWYDRYIARLSPQQIAADRDLPVAAVYEALAYCQDCWEQICAAKDAERLWLQQRGFFAEEP